MSSFAGLTGISGNTDEIETENQCRNKRKKLRQLKEKLITSEDISKQGELKDKIKVLEILIDEWEDKQKEPAEKQDKQKRKDAKKKRKRELKWMHFS